MDGRPRASRLGHPCRRNLRISLDNPPSLWYNMAHRSGVCACFSLPVSLLLEDYTMSRFDYNTVEAKIQGLSIQVGELFADLYKGPMTASDVMERVGGLQVSAPSAPSGA